VDRLSSSALARRVRRCPNDEGRACHDRRMTQEVWPGLLLARGPATDGITR
jgi:hypothetical protein